MIVLRLALPSGTGLLSDLLNTFGKKGAPIMEETLLRAF
jgi:hypothetical protein